ncbi:MAG: aldo/keto reductase [Bryobacterales bacterium]|nr:aldo/keto reductase [Bryobacterales bacterium]
MSKPLDGVGRIGLGCATFGREIDEASAWTVMDAALERGVTLFDTAEAYGGGQARTYRRDRLGIDDTREVSHEDHSSECVLGRWLKERGCRGRIMLCTKVTRGFTRQHVREALDASLRRLGTDFVDVFYYHQFDPGSEPEEAAAALDEAVSSGKARFAGLSNYTAAQMAGMPCHVVQPIYNLVKREVERDLLPYCRQHGIGVVTYSPLGAGFLTGKYTPDRTALPAGTRFHVMPGHADVYFTETNFAAVAGLARLAERTGVPQSRLALAWVLSNPDVGCMLVGARHTGHLDQALEASRLALPAELKTELDALAPVK